MTDDDMIEGVRNLHLVSIFQFKISFTTKPFSKQIFFYFISLVQKSNDAHSTGHVVTATDLIYNKSEEYTEDIICVSVCKLENTSIL